ncbi:hypothetical protein N4G70_29100 [Streptomyces sp. ASQP_92]|uniref:hypothetical protein n=1 Tax=Streptomyces sp. ASQP_92 TaxID=2979116 RepID=UPI0021BFD2A1|nr:hypothetical protein [Streptomyces sp. ASQP_92]MCT9092899.1 hypothetical protein [Streptomyces sp. ASQP_92]
MRHTADTITDDELDALYERLEAAETAVSRTRAVVNERRAQVAEREAERQLAEGYLPLDHPMALWCDTVANMCSEVEYALRTPRKPVIVVVPGEAS